MTMTEKILARAANKSQVSPGENLWVGADVLMTHDVCGPGTIGIFKKEFGADAKVGQTFLTDANLHTKLSRFHTVAVKRRSGLL